MAGAASAAAEAWSRVRRRIIDVSLLVLGAWYLGAAGRLARLCHPAKEAARKSHKPPLRHSRASGNPTHVQALTLPQSLAIQFRAQFPVPRTVGVPPSVRRCPGDKPRT